MHRGKAVMSTDPPPLAPEATEDLVRLQEVGSLLVDIADAQDLVPDAPTETDSSHQWNRNNQGQPKHGLDVEGEAREIIKQIEALSTAHTIVPSQKPPPSNQSYLAQLRKLRPDQSPRRRESKLPQQADQVQALLDQLLSQSKGEAPVGSEGGTEGKESVEDSDLKPVDVPDDETKDTASAEDETKDEADAEECAPSAADGSEAEEQVVEEQEQSSEHEEKKDMIEREFDLGFGNSKNEDCAGRRQQRLLEEVQSMTALCALAKMLHGLNQHPQAAAIEQQAVEMRNDLVREGVEELPTVEELLGTYTEDSSTVGTNTEDTTVDSTLNSPKDKLDKQELEETVSEEIVQDS